MSRWTHIRGCIELEASPYDMVMKDGTKLPHNPKTWNCSEDVSYVLPYPDEQIQIAMPRYFVTMKSDSDGDDGCYQELDAEIYSLPRAKPIIERIFKNTFPDNELGLGVAHSLGQFPHNASSMSSSCLNETLERQVKNSIAKLYEKHSTGFPLVEYDDISERDGDTRIGDIHEITRVLLSIRDDVRYCSGAEMMRSIKAFLDKITLNDILIEDGYLEWEDEWAPDYLFAWRKSRMDNKVYEFMILDAYTNERIYTETYLLPKGKDGSTDYFSKEFVKETTGEAPECLDLFEKDEEEEKND